MQYLLLLVFMHRKLHYNLMTVIVVFFFVRYYVSCMQYNSLFTCNYVGFGRLQVLLSGVLQSSVIYNERSYLKRFFSGT